MCVCTCTRWAEIWVHLRIDVRYSISDNFWYYSLEFSSFHFALICERTTFILDEFCNIPHVVHSIESISSAFVIVVWGRNFKYSLSINSKQTLPIENLCILKQPRIPFIFQNTEISLVFTRTLASLSLSSLFPCPDAARTHANIFKKNIFIIMFGNCGLNLLEHSNRLHVMNQTEFKLKNNELWDWEVGCFFPFVCLFPLFSGFHLIFDVWVQVENC